MSKNRGTRGGFLVGKLVIAGGVAVMSLAGTPVDGTSGTGAGEAAPSSLCFDTTNKRAYMNVGTQASPVWVAVSSETLVRYAAVALTAAQVKALRATPATLVAAPGAGLMHEFLSAELFLDYGGTNGFTESADNLAVKYTDESGAAVSQAIEMTGFIDQTADTKTNALAKVDAIVAKAGCENQALVLHNTGDGEIAGNAAADNVLRVKVAYRTHTTGW